MTELPAMQRTGLSSQSSEGLRFFDSTMQQTRVGFCLWGNGCRLQRQATSTPLKLSSISTRTSSDSSGDKMHWTARTSHCSQWDQEGCLCVHTLKTRTKRKEALVHYLCVADDATQGKHLAFSFCLFWLFFFLYSRPLGCKEILLSPLDVFTKAKLQTNYFLSFH